jgi:HK97 family phage portal protein
MGVLADLDRWLVRTFNPGSLSVGQSALTFGVPVEEFAPQEYGDYIRTSTAVYTVVKKRATYLASLPLVLSRLKADGTSDPVTKGALFDLMRRVNPYWTARRLIEMTEMSLCLWGSAYWFLERGASANQPPTQIYWGRPDRVTVVPHPTKYVARFDYQPVSGMEPLHYSPAEVIWFRYPNPLEEYAGLSPLVSARLAADTQSAAMKQNRQLFVNGISLGGLVTPAPGAPMNKEQAAEIRDQLKERAKGTANAHRWLVLMHDAKFQPMTLSPRDAEFVELHKLTLEDVCRSYGIPLDLVGGQRTYANLGDAIKLMWTDTILPEAAFIADELSEQLLPMFTASGDRADSVHFDDSGIDVLQSDHKLEWDIASGQLDKGVITINEWRADQKKDPLPWGEEVWWGNLSLTPITTSEAQVVAPPPPPPPAALPPGDGTTPPTDTTTTDTQPARTRLAVPDGQRVAYDSPEHKRLWRAFVQRTERHEQVVASTTRRLFRQQEQSILTELSKISDQGQVVRAAQPDDLDSFMGKILNLARWRKRFRETIRPILGKVVADGGQAAIDEVSLGGSFSLSDPKAAQFLERKSQKFAVEVNSTTWDTLKVSLGEGLDAGEGTDQLAQRVKTVMGDRIRSSAEVIARTEVLSSYNGGALEGYRQSGVVDGKQWLASLDERTRSTHVDAHGQVVALDEDFEVGAGSGPAPGQIGLPEEDIMCRCAMLAVLAPI